MSVLVDDVISELNSEKRKGQKLKAKVENLQSELNDFKGCVFEQIPSRLSLNLDRMHY